MKNYPNDLDLLYNILYEKFNKFNVNKFYLDKYLKFVIFRTYLNNKNNITENINKHHILPQGKSFFPEFKNLNQFQFNKSILTYKEHFIAHKLLINVFEDNDLKAKNVHAMNFICKGKKNNIDINVINEKQRQLMKDYNPMKNKESIEKMIKSLNEYHKSNKRKTDHLIGKLHHTEETKNKLSQYWKGKKKPKRTEEHTLNIKKSNSWKTIVTPWGNFLSLLEAANDKNNTENISRALIEKYCKNEIAGFRFIKTKELITPWGKFDSYTLAANDKNNTERISKNVIKSLAEKNLQGFSIQKYN